MEQTGLVLEGGGSRGVYTAGVLHYLMEQDIYIPYTIGVSAGACNGSSYIFDQERQGNIFVISPSEKLKVGRVERNKDKLTALYQLGYEDVKEVGDQLKEFLAS